MCPWFSFSASSLICATLRSFFFLALNQISSPFHRKYPSNATKMRDNNPWSTLSPLKWNSSCGRREAEKRKKPQHPKQEKQPQQNQTYSRTRFDSCLRNLSRTRLHSGRPCKTGSATESEPHRTNQEIQLQIQSILSRLSSCRRPPSEAAVPGHTIPRLLLVLSFGKAERSSSLKK